MKLSKVLIKLKNKNIGILITDHNVREALEICDHAIVINNGSLLLKVQKFINKR